MNFTCYFYLPKCHSNAIQNFQKSSTCSVYILDIYHTYTYYSICSMQMVIIEVDESDGINWTEIYMCIEIFTSTGMEMTVHLCTWSGLVSSGRSTAYALHRFISIFGWVTQLLFIFSWFHWLDVCQTVLLCWSSNACS